VVKNDFNPIAPIYDFLVTLVFGDGLWKAQHHHLHRIDADDTVLILGGGSGNLLEWLPKCKVVYLEKAEKMVSRAQKRGHAEFIVSDFLEWESEKKFDWVICPFFLDCFTSEELDQALVKIQSGLKANGRLLVIDFQNKMRSQQFLIKSMLLFFRLVAGLSARELVDFRTNLPERGFALKEQRDFLNGLVFSDVYCKSTPDKSSHLRDHHLL